MILTQGLEWSYRPTNYSPQRALIADCILSTKFWSWMHVSANRRSSAIQLSIFQDQTWEREKAPHTEYGGTDASSPSQTSGFRCDERTKHALFFFSCQSYTEPLAEPLTPCLGSVLHSSHIPGPHLDEKLGELGELCWVSVVVDSTLYMRQKKLDTPWINTSSRSASASQGSVKLTVVLNGTKLERTSSSDLSW